MEIVHSILRTVVRPNTRVRLRKRFFRTILYVYSFNTPPVAFVPDLLDLVQPRYLYSADAEMFVFASVVDPAVLAFIS